MNAEDVLRLISAGFTADEIRQMTRPTAAQDPPPAPAAEPVPAANPAPSPAAEPAAIPETAPAAAPTPDPAPAGPDPLDSIKQQIAGLTSIVETMSKSIIMPNMDSVNPLGVEDIISKFFKED